MTANIGADVVDLAIVVCVVAGAVCSLAWRFRHPPPPACHPAPPAGGAAPDVVIGAGLAKGLARAQRRGRA